VREGKFSGQIGLPLRNRPGVKHLAFDAVLPGSIEVTDRAGKRCIGAKQLDPAGPSQQLRHASLRDQRFMFGQAA